MNTNATARPRVRIGGAGVDVVSRWELPAGLDELIESGSAHYVCFCEAHLCVRATREPDLRRVLDRASLVLPDGVSMTLGARLIGRRLPDRLPGPSVMLEYCRHGLSKGRRHFFYGGAEGVGAALAARLRERFPGLEVAGTFAPPFRPLTRAEEAEVGRRIDAARPDVLWVGLGAPKQEHWMAEHVGRLDVPLMLGVGAAFDFHSGRRPWAPWWVRRLGLEWAYRAATGGGRVLLRNAEHDARMVGILAGQVLARGSRIAGVEGGSR
jgi:N-acetylglucosaminyldiphosphoundecaprenol N-acetyl-beta-D-mannosaminyltransferase